MIYGHELWFSVQTPISWAHGIDDRTVLFEAGQAGPPFLAKAGVSCEFKVNLFNFFKFLLDSPLMVRK